MILSDVLTQMACNYDAEADCDDESCLYLDECGNCGGNDTLGCTDSAACNYDMDADCDDNSCVYGCDLDEEDFTDTSWMCWPTG